MGFGMVGSVVWIELSAGNKSLTDTDFGMRIALRIEIASAIDGALFPDVT